MDKPGCVSNCPPSRGDRAATGPECVPLTWSITEDMLFSAFSMLSGTEEIFWGCRKYSSAFPNCGVSSLWAPGCLRSSAAGWSQINHCKHKGGSKPQPAFPATVLLLNEHIPFHPCHWVEEEEEDNFCMWVDCCRNKHLNKRYYILSWL